MEVLIGPWIVLDFLIFTQNFVLGYFPPFLDNSKTELLDARSTDVIGYTVLEVQTDRQTTVQKCRKNISRKREY